MRHLARTGLIVLAAWGFAAVAAADPAPPSPRLAVDGQVNNPRTWMVEDLQKLPATRVRVAYSSDHGQEEAVYTGGLLWEIIRQAAPIDGPGPGAFLRRVVLVTGSDGYAVALAWGEIDPDFEGKDVILAYAKDGTPLKPEQGIRLIVPDDKRGNRAVRDVVKITVSGLGAQPRVPQEPRTLPPKPGFQ